MLRIHAGRKRKHVVPVVAITYLIILWFWILYWGSLPSLNLLSSFSGPSDVFDFSPLKSEAIQKVCAGVEWNPDIVFTCDRSVGGVGNIRNSVLHCVRYAISAGASLVIPRIVIRNPKDVAIIHTKERVELDYMFDRHHFVESLRLSCPQLRLYNTITDVPNYKAAQKKVGTTLDPARIMERVPHYGLAHPEDFQQRFYEWLKKHFPDATTGTTVVALARLYLQYPIYTDSEVFALSFGEILKFRPDVRRLATLALVKMSKALSLPKLLIGNYAKKAFFGAHLRTEKDAVNGFTAFELSAYEAQSKLYLEQAASTNMKVLYVASGNDTEINRFADDARIANMTVITKHDLLEGEDLKKLNALTWDQQALVDFLVLSKSSYFAGVGHTSFALNIALLRHQWARAKNHLNGPQQISDDLSVIFGKVHARMEYVNNMWP
ncbi:hypothetical protein BP5796_06825 [Coleophoma crateriformis]|uniref:Alternative oxidase n=1 Tax=Coleophoma crateriformis TaxID=565419 RepID=A0A3D8RQ44_9HELO|nr:hypothetical protein BP5796_06825 [Coleophoma crateriformis]